MQITEDKRKNPDLIAKMIAQPDLKSIYGLFKEFAWKISRIGSILNEV